MAESSENSLCNSCGRPLDEKDIRDQRGDCHKCRSPWGKLAEIELAICGEGDDPIRIPQYRSIFYWLSERFGQALSELALWGRFTDHLREKLGLSPNDYLRLVMDRVVDLLASDSAFNDRTAWVKAIEASCLADRQRIASRSGDDYYIPQKTHSAQETPDVSESEEEQSPEAERNKSEKQPFTPLDRYPASPAGHIRFIEYVRYEVHNAAEAKRHQVELGYTNATIESMVTGIKWAEAGKRLDEMAELTELPADIVEKVAAVLRRELTVGTVEQIDEELTSAVLALRDAWEYRIRGDRLKKPSAPRNPKETDPPKQRESRKANLNHWGIGLDKKSKWQVFHRKRKDSWWQLQGVADIPQGLVHDVLKLLAENGGSAEKSELLETLRMQGKTDHETMAKRVSPTLCKLREAIKEAINRAGKFDEVGDPLPPPNVKRDKWIAAITIGFAVTSDTLSLPEGDKLTMSEKLILLTAEQLELLQSC